MTNLQKIKHYTIGDRQFYSHVIKIVAPIVIQNTVTNVVSLLDNVMIGATGTLQMSAVAIINQLLFIFYLAIFGGYAGAGIFATQYVGSRDSRGIRYCFRAKIYIGLLCLGVASIILIGFPDKLIAMYLAEGTVAADAAETLTYGKSYLNVMLIGLPAFAISQVYGGTLREMGETRVPMLASIAAIGVNLVFNYIFIFGNEGLKFLWFAPMGVTGAAIATVMSRFVEMLIIVLYVHRNTKNFEFIKGVYNSVKIPKELAFNILKRGTPLLVNEILWSTGMAAIMQCYSERGLDVVAATNISSTVNNLFNVVFLSMGNAIAIIVGHMLGANEVKKARVTVWRMLTLSVVSCFAMGGLMALLAPIVPNIYNTTHDVKAMATKLLYVVAAMMPFYAFVHGCYFALRSGGRTVITFIFDSAFTWGLVFPAAFLLANFTQMPIITMYICVQLIDVLKCAVGFVLIKKGIWIHNIVEG